MAINHTTLQGRFVEDPVFGDTNSGTKYANFRLAWSEKYKEKETKCFLECKAFGGTAQFMEKFMNKRGQEIIVEGKLNTEEWEKDGQKRSKIALIVSNVHFSGSKKDGGSAEAAPAQEPAGYTPVDSEQLPF